MKIKKQLNNSVVVATRTDGTEVVVMGKGIAFGKKPGEAVDQSLIQKVFVFQDSSDKTSLINLFERVPEEYLLVANEIIEKAKKVLSYTLSDSIYTTLTDHLYLTVQRFLKGITIPNPLAMDIRMYYPDEYTAGEIAVRVIDARLKVKLPEDEVGFFAFHFANAQNKQSGNKMYKVLEMTKELTNLIRYELKIDFSESTVSYRRLITHIRFFCQRVLLLQKLSNGLNSRLYKSMANHYQRERRCVEKIAEFVQAKYDYQTSEEDKLYLLIHIVNLTDGK